MDVLFAHSKHRSRRRLRLVLPALLVSLLALILPAVASAHPLGNFTVNRYSRLELGTNQVQIVYVLDMAEIPAFQEQSLIDVDRDGTVGAAEQTSYLAAQVARLRENLHLAAGGTSLTLEPRDPQLEFPEGQGGLKTLRLSARFVAALPNQATTWQASYRDDNYANRLGWQEVVVQPAAGARLLTSSAPTQDVSQELRNYPQDLLQSPPMVNSATFSFEAAPGLENGAGQAAENAALSQAPGANPQAPIANLRYPDQFAALIAAPTTGPVALLVALAIAFGLGAAHALAPGHGKTVVAAYLVGSRGTILHAILLGLTTTVTHTAGVFALGFVTLFVSRFILPEQLYPWLGAISGLLVVIIGVSLLRGRLRTLLGAPAHSHHHHGHDHHHHDRDHHHGHDHDHDHGPHTHTHDHDHAIADWAAAKIQNPHAKSQNEVSWRSLLALGISGGLLPCPSALVVLLSAIALGRVGFGLLLIVAFSLGLAGVLTGIGILLVHAGRLFERIPVRGRVIRALPVASALVVIGAGAVITLQALAQTGLLPL